MQQELSSRQRATNPCSGQRAADNVQRTTCDRKCATNCAQRTSCSGQRAADNVQRTTCSRQGAEDNMRHATDKMEQTTCKRQYAADIGRQDVRQTKCNGHHGTDNVRLRKCRRRHGADTVDAADMEQAPVMQPTWSGQRAADSEHRATWRGERAAVTMKQTAYNRQHAADNVDPTTRRQPTDPSVEVQPMAMPCVREVVRRAERTSSVFFPADAACAIETPRAARACVRACTRRKPAAGSRRPATRPLDSQHAAKPDTARRGAEQSDHCADWPIGASESDRTHATRANRRRAADDVQQAPCRTATGTVQRQPSSSRSQRIACSRHDQCNETHQCIGTTRSRRRAAGDNAHDNAQPQTRTN